MIGFYVTDYGKVRVSDRELRILELAEDVKRAGMEQDFWPLLHKATALRDACIRVAKYKAFS